VVGDAVYGSRERLARQLGLDRPFRTPTACSSCTRDGAEIDIVEPLADLAAVLRGLEASQ